MTTPTQSQTRPEATVIVPLVLHDLRALTPARRLSHIESLRLAERQATALRQLLQIAEDRFPIHRIRQIPHVSIRTVCDLPVSGLTFWGEHTWKIQVRAGESLVHRRFTVLHELKHIIDHPLHTRLYDERAYVATGERELVADYFSACALIPADRLRAAHSQTNNRKALAAHFGVSGRQMARRIAELGLDDDPASAGHHSTKGGSHDQ